MASRLRANWGADVRIIATDINPSRLVTTSLIADSYHQVPRTDDPTFPSTLSNILKAEKVDIYIPILNGEITTACTLLDDSDFEDVDLGVTPIYEQLVDKSVANDWLESIGVDVPMTVRSRQDIVLTEQYFGKPKDGFGSTGAQAYSGSNLLSMSSEELDQLIIQEVQKAPEITIDSFYDIKTDTLFAFCRERLETKAGVCTKARVFQDPDLEDFARRIGKGLGQRGAICFQVMKGRDGWRVTDLNLRTGGGTAITCAAGFDIFSAMYALRTGEPYDSFFVPLDPGSDVLVTRQYSEFVMGYT